MDQSSNRIDPIKRKPLPQTASHTRTVSEKLTTDSVSPLLSIDDRPAWALPPLTNPIESDKGDSNAEPFEDVEASKSRWWAIPHLGSLNHHSRRRPRHLTSEEKTAPSHQSRSVSQDARSPDGDAQQPPQMWNSPWLHPLVLYAFMFLFLILVAALIILWRFTRLDHGIKTDITNNHYAWTYGPTALLVVISVAWGQVDHHCRRLAPWAHLQSGPTSARQSLLLDYVSPALPKTLLAATIYHDWAVLASGLAALLLKIVIVFSTGLLVLTPTLVSTTISDAVINSRIAGMDSTLVTTDLLTQLSLYYGIQEQGMDYPYGTTPTVAYDTVDLEPLRPNSTITAMVDGMFPFFNCEVVTPVIVGDDFTWKNDSWTDPGDRLDLTLTLYPKNCPPLVSIYDTICMAPKCPIGRSIQSKENWNWPDPYEWNLTQPLNDLDPCANLYQLTVIDMTYARVAGRSPNTSAGWDVNLQNQIGLVCGLGYTINKVNVTINTADPVSVDGVNTTGPLRRVADVLPGLSYFNLTQDFQNHFTLNSLPPQKNAAKIDGFAKLVAILAGGYSTALLNETILKNTAEKAFKGVAVQFAQSHLPKSNDVTTTATSSYTDARLQLRQVSLWAMGTGFVLLAICAVAVLVWRKRDAVSLNPQSIGSQAVILAASPSLQKCLTAAAGRSEVQLKASLEELVATSRVTRERKISEFFIETAASNEGKEQSPNDTNSIHWWTARPRQVWFVSVALILPLAVIAALEIAQHESDKHQGLATVSATSSVEHSLPSILSSIVMISIAMIYDAIGFVAATLAPYEKLARGNTTARRNILESSVGVLPVWSTFKAIRAHHFTAAVASVAMLIGSLLTIISSGLYTLDTVAFALDITVTTADKFVPSFGTSTDGSAGAVFTLVEHNNASYPALTYDGLAFPDMDLASLGKEAMKQLSDPEEPVTLHASVVATRASLNCTLVPRDIMNITMINVADHWNPCLANQLTFNTSLPPTCPHFLNANNETATDISFAFTVQQLCPKNAVQGLYQSVVLNNQGAVLPDTFISVGPTLGAESNPPGCPSLAFLTGYFVENVTSTENVTAMTCIQGLEEVHAWTAFAITKDSIQIKSEPIVDERSARWLMAFNSTYWFTNPNTFTSFDFDHNTMLLEDYFYDSVRCGPQGVPIEEYTGPSNTQRFIDVTQHTYRRYMAQLISSTMRKSLNSTELASSPPSYSGTVSGVNRLRLKQNATSKLILQIFLGIMLACGVFVYSYRRVRQLLPHSPYSIAGTMSLLAGSEMIERNIVPAGAEFMSEKELARVYDGYLFSLGWWGDSSEKEGTGVVGRRQQSRRFGIDIGSAHGRVKA